MRIMTEREGYGEDIICRAALWHHLRRYGGLFMPTPEDYRMPFEVVRKSVLPDYSDKSDKSEKSDKSDKSTQHWKCKKPTERTMAIMERAMQRASSKRALDIDGQRHFMLVNLRHRA